MLHTELQDGEFQEADILWPDAADFQESPLFYFSQFGIVDDDDDDDGDSSSEHQLPLELQARQKASSPIDVPGRKVVGATGAKGTDAVAGLFISKFGASHAGVGAGTTVVGSHVFMPPHVIIDRRAKRDKAMLMLIVPTGRARARKMLE